MATNTQMLPPQQRWGDEPEEPKETKETKEKREPCPEGVNCAANKEKRCDGYHPKWHTPCTYGFNCWNKNNSEPAKKCRYGHPPGPLGQEPEACRYGQNYTNPRCNFDHPDRDERRREKSPDRRPAARAKSPAPRRYPQQDTERKCFCTKCGKQAGAQDNFCGGCGAKLN